MKTKYFILAASALVALASCSNDEYIGDNNGLTAGQGDGSIQFAYTMPNATRADVVGSGAADILDNGFYVTGTKGTEQETYPSPTLVFDNYLVHYGANTAGKTESNTANWEYVGVTPGTSPYEKWVKLSAVNIQTIKYWDYSADQYDFIAFSTGKKTPVSGNPGDGEIGVTKMKYGSDLASSGVAYTFIIPDAASLENTFITDITTVKKANYGNDVVLKFKNIGAKVRMALYETVPGYSVKDVKFYTVDKADASVNDLAGDHSETACLISADANGILKKGTIAVYFPHVGTKYQPGATEAKEDYNKAAATLTAPGSATASDYDKAPTFGTLTANYTDKDPAGYEATGKYLGRSLPEATFAGDKNAQYYKAIFPVSTSPAALTLRVDYTLVSTDGSGEEIHVYGAKAVVPSTYTKWLPNYAYTYIFKISDNTNGWTNTAHTKAGLFPITFDAVVAQATEATGEQTTITTVSTPTITTYQQNHNPLKPQNEYSKATGKNIYVQVMDNTVSPATLVTTLNGTAPVTAGDETNRSLLYSIPAGKTEALVMDALQNQSKNVAGTITGRNGVVLTPVTINATVNQIENGADDNPISVSAGEAAKITITGDGELAAGTYAYVYDYSTVAKTTIDEYQPLNVSGGTVGTTGTTYYYLANTSIDSGAETVDNEAVDNDYLYFSVTTNGGATKTYSYFSVAGKSKVIGGLKKIAKSDIESQTIAGGSAAAAATFYFEKYINNDGKYAVKVIIVTA